MVKFTDFNAFPAFIAKWKPFAGRELERATKQAYDDMIDNWENGQDAMGRPWEPLAPSTVEAKGHGRPLIETRQMIDSADYDVDRSELQTTIYIDDEAGKVALHEFGAADQGVPARPILQPAAKRMEEDMNDALGEAVDLASASALARGGLGITGALR